MILKDNNGSLALFYEDRKVFESSADSPFAAAVQSEEVYRSSHGNFKIKEKIKSRQALSSYRIISQKSNCAEVEFFSGGKSLSVAIEEKENGVYLRFSPKGFSCAELRFCASATEAIFGGGEQYRKLNMKGERIINFVSEHIVIPPIAQKTVLKFLPYKEKSHSYIETYCPMTTYVSSEKYALRFDVASYGVADFRNKDVSVFRFSECPSSAFYTAKSDFKGINRALNADIPCKEYLPDWAYDGLILGVQGGIDRAIKKARELKENGVKVCAVWCQDWSGKKVTAAGKQVYWNWEADNDLYPRLKENIAELNREGIRFLAYINPYLVRDGKLYCECRDKGYLIKNKDGEIYHVKSTTFDAGMLDLTNPDAVKYIKETLIGRNMLDLGVDGYMADFGEYLPVDCVLSSGDAKELHNEWPTIWAKLNREAVESHPRAKEIFFFTRSGFNGAQSYTTMMWNGDQHTDFSKDYGMPCVMPATFNLGFSGVAAVHSDIGGFISFASLRRDKELFVRWMEMNAFSPLMRSHETIRPEANVQPYSEEIIGYAASLTAVHAKLKPYLIECMRTAEEGIPVMRPDFYNYGDYSLGRDEYSYMLGDEIYVAPVIERGAKEREVRLPDGEWVRFFDNKPYIGGTIATVDVPLGKPAAFYKKDGKYAKLFATIGLGAVD